MTPPTPMAVPTVERRRRRRLLTWRNVTYAVLVLLVIVAGLNIRSEMRDTTGSDEYGRLYGRDIDKAPQPEPARVTATEVSPVNEAASADPFALDAARREQYLGTVSLEPVPLIDPVSPLPPVVRAEGSAVRIVGGPDGVTLLQEEKKSPPALGGGFGRP